MFSSVQTSQIKIESERLEKKYLGIVEADTTKQAEMKEKKQEKSTADAGENYSKPRSAIEIL